MSEGSSAKSCCKEQATSSEDDGSGGEDHYGGDSTDDVFVYDGVGIGGGLNDLDGTPQNDENRLRCKGQLRAFNTKRTNRQGSVVETNSGRVSNAPSRDGGATRLCPPQPEGAAEAAVTPETTPWGAVASPHQHHHLRKTAERVPAAGGKVSQRLRPTRHSTPHPRRIAGRELPSAGLILVCTGRLWKEW